jgi:hypothetical protein
MLKLKYQQTLHSQTSEISDYKQIFQSSTLETQSCQNELKLNTLKVETLENDLHASKLRTKDAQTQNAALLEDKLSSQKREEDHQLEMTKINIALEDKDQEIKKKDSQIYMCYAIILISYFAFFCYLKKPSIMMLLILALILGAFFAIHYKNLNSIPQLKEKSSLL